jgi:hypothetical protein
MGISVLRLDYQHIGCNCIEKHVLLTIHDLILEQENK